MNGRHGRALAGGLALLLAAGCAAGGGAGRRSADVPAEAIPDSATVLVWHLDEATGFRVIDSGSRGLEGRAGVDTRPGLGRVRGGREFTRSVDSFLYAEYQAAMEAPDALSVEAWVRVDAFGQYEDTPIAMRWNYRTGDKSWLFSVGGRNLGPPVTASASPGDHSELVIGFTGRSFGRLMFALQSREAGGARAFFSNQQIELGRWTHVAATYDGRVVCLYLNGRLDAQYAMSGGIRPSFAPLIAGNAIETRFLTSYGSEVRLGTEADHNPYYAFQGAIDELRVSNIARTDFPSN